MVRPVGSLIQQGSRLAHGGRTVIPFQCQLRVYDETIRVLKSAVQNARLGREEELGAIKRLDQQARQLEVWAKAPSFEAVLTGHVHQGGQAIVGHVENQGGGVTHKTEGSTHASMAKGREAVRS
jgi:hypothetical protein